MDGLLFLVLALLVGNTAGGLAGGLAGSLALAAAADNSALAQIAGLNGLNSAHVKIPHNQNISRTLYNTRTALVNPFSPPGTFPAAWSGEYAAASRRRHRRPLFWLLFLVCAGRLGRAVLY